MWTLILVDPEELTASITMYSYSCSTLLMHSRWPEHNNIKLCVIFYEKGHVRTRSNSNSSRSGM